MIRLLYLVIALLTLSVAVSCIDRPDFVLDEPEMVDVLVDVHRAEGLLEIQNRHSGGSLSETDNFEKSVIAAVLQKHGVTRAQYDSSLMWYAQHLNRLTRVYGHVDERLKEENEYWGLQVSEAQDFAASEAGDSVQLWTLREHLVLDKTRHLDMRFWEFPSDSNFLAGDTLRWQFHIRQLLPGQQLVASIALTEVPEEENRPYGSNKPKRVLTGDPLGSVQQVITANGKYQLSATVDSVQPFGSAIIGLSLFADSTYRTPVFVDSISLIRIHLK